MCRHCLRMSKHRGLLLSRWTIFLILLFSYEVKTAGYPEKRFPGNSPIFFFKNLFIFRKRGREGEKEGEKHQ